MSSSRSNALNAWHGPGALAALTRGATMTALVCIALEGRDAASGLQAARTAGTVFESSACGAGRPPWPRGTWAHAGVHSPADLRLHGHHMGGVLFSPGGQRWAAGAAHPPRAEVRNCTAPHQWAQNCGTVERHGNAASSRNAAATCSGGRRPRTSHPLARTPALAPNFRRVAHLRRVEATGWLGHRHGAGRAGRAGTHLLVPRTRAVDRPRGHAGKSVTDRSITARCRAACGQHRARLPPRGSHGSCTRRRITLRREGPAGATNCEPTLIARRSRRRDRRFPPKHGRRPAFLLARRLQLRV
jgi:hypothetical protein